MLRQKAPNGRLLQDVEEAIRLESELLGRVGELRISHCGHNTADPKSLTRGPKNQNFEKWEKKCPVCNTIVCVMVPIFASEVWAVLRQPPSDKLAQAASIQELIDLVEKGKFEEKVATKLPILALQTRYLDVFAKSMQQSVTGFADYCQRAQCYALQADVELLGRTQLLLSHALFSLMAGLELRGFASEVKEKAELYHNLFIAYRLSMAAEPGQQKVLDIKASMCGQLTGLLRLVLAGDANLEAIYCRVVVLFVGSHDVARSPSQRARLPRSAQGGHAGFL